MFQKETEFKFNTMEQDNAIHKLKVELTNTTPVKFDELVQGCTKAFSEVNLNPTDSMRLPKIISNFFSNSECINGKAGSLLRLVNIFNFVLLLGRT